jgi:cell wall-associated NlpC family hydrolase
MQEWLHIRRLIARLCMSFLIIAQHTGCKRVQRGTPDVVLETIEQVRQRYCPDRRLEVFDINVQVRGANLKLSGEVSNPVARQALVKSLRTVAHTYKIEEEIVVLPEPRLGHQRFGVINVSVANLRSAPRHSAELINQMLTGSSVALLKQTGDWFYGQVEDRSLGWLNAGSLVRTDSAGLAAWQLSELLRFADLGGKIRVEPDENALPISDVVLGGLLRRGEQNREAASRSAWTQVVLPDGRAGYLLSQTLSSGMPSAVPIGAGARIVATAQRFLGIPYLWGGTTVRGFDASGFIQTVFAQNGIRLLRDASQQAREGEVVEIDDAFANLRAGDLLFFGNSPEQITHVAISLSGPRYIHASDYVHINSLNPKDADYDETRARTLQMARRYLHVPPISGRGKF